MPRYLIVSGDLAYFVDKDQLIFDFGQLEDKYRNNVSATKLTLSVLYGHSSPFKNSKSVREPE